MLYMYMCYNYMKTGKVNITPVIGQQKFIHICHYLTRFENVAFHAF